MSFISLGGGKIVVIKFRSETILWTNTLQAMQLFGQNNSYLSMCVEFFNIQELKTA